MKHKKIPGLLKERMKQKTADFLIKKVRFSKEKMAKYAYKNTRIYKNLYNASGYRENDLKALPFHRLPVMNKHFISRHTPFDMLSEPLKDKVFKYAETTGSTGNPTPSFYTKKEFQSPLKLARLTPLISMLLDSTRNNKKAVCGMACGFTIAGSTFQQILENLGFLTINVDARTTIAPPERVARLLSRYMPSVIVAGETDFLAWMKVLKENYFESYKKVRTNLKVLISTAELCSENRSSRIEEFFDILHVDNYGCVEGYFSMACKCGEKHIPPAYYTEVFTEDLKNSSEWGSGRFAFTNLVRKSSPFVRYLLDDWVTIYPSNCPYGYKKSIIPHGRYELTVKIDDEVYGTRDFENILFKDYLFGEYCIEVENEKIIITAEDYQRGKLDKEKIIKNFENFFRINCSLNIVPYGSLRDYHEIRKSKPLLRLMDRRAVSTQSIPRYL